MKINIREFQPHDLASMREIWNHVVEEGIAFPQLESLSETDAPTFFGAQSSAAVAESDGQILGLYILHPNNIGRCGHLANASYAVDERSRGQHIGEALVRHSLEKAKALGFGVLQFNAVVATNERALRLYETLGFTRLGTIPRGFRLKDGRFEDIVLFYYSL